MLERLAGNEYYCFLEGFLGYFQIPIDLQDQEKTTFTCPYGTFAYQRMPFGLCNAPGTFQSCMMAIFHDMIEETMEVFMDDFSVFENSFSSCLSYLDKMLKRCKDTNLVLNWEKCHFMVKEGIVLGHKISKSGGVAAAKTEFAKHLEHMIIFDYRKLDLLIFLVRHDVRVANDDECVIILQMDGLARPGASKGVSKRSHFRFASEAFQKISAKNKKNRSFNKVPPAVGSLSVARRVYKNELRIEEANSTLTLAEICLKQLKHIPGHIKGRSASTRNSLGNEKLRLDLIHLKRVFNW
ncbi:reverse transcriptase domain-containing protein [Tanacetum coccineum]